MSATINKLNDNQGNQIYPVTHERAVRDNNGTTLESKIQQLQQDTAGVVEEARTAAQDVLDNRAVRTDEAQSLTDAQKAQALSNVGISGIDEVPTSGSDNLVKSGGVQGELALGAVYDVSAKNPTAGPNNDGKFASLSALLNDVNLNTLIPTSWRKGGMTIRFVLSSDNKYVQFRYMLEYANTTAGNQAFLNTANWQGVDAIPTQDSKNLVESGGVADSFANIEGEIGGTQVRAFINWKNGTIQGGNFQESATVKHVCKITDFGDAERITVKVANTSNTYNAIAFYNINVVSDGADGYMDGVLIDDTSNPKTYTAIIPEGTKTILIGNNNEDFSDDLVEINIIGGGLTKRKVNKITYSNLVDTSKSVSGKLGSGGTVSSDNLYKTTASIAIENGKQYAISPRLRRMAFYSTSKVNDAERFIDAALTNYVFTAPYDGFIRFTYYVEDDSTVNMYQSSMVNPLDKVEENVHLSNTMKDDVNAMLTEFGQTKVSVVRYVNLVDVSTSDDNKVITATTGALKNSDLYKTTAFIAIENGKSYCIKPRFRVLAFYTNNSVDYYDSAKTVNSEQADYIFTAPYNGYIKFSYYKADDENTVGMYNSSTADINPKAEEGIHLSDTMKDDVRSLVNTTTSKLYGKKWVACGDSFTHGDFDGQTSDNYDSTLGLYKTYPYWIAKRNGMTLVNEAVNGSCLAVDPRGLTTYFSNERYQQIPEDADYITIKLGINDSHQEVPIGTIDDNTNATFYGAWNVVLSWLCVNRPNAKIGLICTNGADAVGYSDATEAIAKKYHVAYINEATGDNMPFFYRQDFMNVPQTIRDTKTALYRVSSNNGHPNVLCHQYESTIIEDFLNSL